MQIKFSPYKRRDGSLMLYINRSNKVSIGVSPERGYSPYGKGITPGQRNAYDAACRTARIAGVTFTGDLARHSEGGFSAPVECGAWTLVATDVATIGGMPVGGDGPYVVFENRIIRCNEWIDEAE